MTTKTKKANRGKKLGKAKKLGSIKPLDGFNYTKVEWTYSTQKTH
jgi:hypothetical protein